MSKINKKYRLLVLGLIVAIYFNLTCSKKNDSNPVNPTGNDQYTETISPSGGTVEDDDPDSDTYGISIEIPEGALIKETTISIQRTKSISELPTEALKQIGHCYDFNKTDDTYFEKVIKITIPVTVEEVDTSNCFMAYYDSDQWVRNG